MIEGLLVIDASLEFSLLIFCAFWWLFGGGMESDPQTERIGFIFIVWSLSLLYTSLSISFWWNGHDGYMVVVSAFTIGIGVCALLPTRRWPIYETAKRVEPRKTAELLETLAEG